MTVSAENSQQLHHVRFILSEVEGTHHGNVKDVSFDSEAETTWMSPFIGTDEDASRYYGRGVAKGMRGESFKVFHHTLVVH